MDGLEFEGRGNHIWKFSPHRRYVWMIKLAETTSGGSLGSEGKVFMDGSLCNSDLEG